MRDLSKASIVALLLCGCALFLILALDAMREDGDPTGGPGVIPAESTSNETPADLPKESAEQSAETLEVGDASESVGGGDLSADSKYAIARDTLQKVAPFGSTYSAATIKKYFGPEDLPQFYKMLSDQSHYSEWPVVANSIGWLAEPGEAERVLIEFTRRNIDWVGELPYVSRTGVFIAKYSALESLGRIGGEEGVDYLRRMLDEEQAAVLLEEWMDIDFGGATGNAVGEMSGVAARGLVKTRDAQNIQLVRDKYTGMVEVLSDAMKREKLSRVESARLQAAYSKTISALARADAREEIELENYEGSWLNLVFRHVEKYPTFEELTQTDQ